MTAGPPKGLLWAAIWGATGALALWVLVGVVRNPLISFADRAFMAFFMAGFVLLSTIAALNALGLLRPRRLWGDASSSADRPTKPF